MNPKTKKVIKWVIIGSVLTVLTIITLLAWLVTMFITGGRPQKSSDYKDYKEIYNLMYDSRSGMVVFPEELPQNMTEISFSYSYQDTFNFPTVYIFLQGTYNQEEYDKEVERLEHTHKVYGGTKKELLRDEEGDYPYPAYIAVENHSRGYEYALLTGENQITYILTAFFEKDKIPFDKKYLPTDFMTEEGRTFGSGYSIYVKSQDSSMISYDYTRSENVEVEQCHTEMFQDNFFMVRVRLDEENWEIIQQCEYHEYEEGTWEKLKDEPESTDTFWMELQGYEFVDLRIDRTNDTVVVTYLDGEEKKEWRVGL